jgi:DNA repair protein SbcC/Rad50
MIPISLSLSNFMAYGTNVPALSFSGIHVASICGDNGSGKSSIIDAITWALWGKARARGDDDLMRQGETDMQVQFDFAVGKEVYRVIRKHSAPRTRRTSGQSSLDLFISHDGAFRPISADRMSETERKIADILHMDYDTFVNSAFLRQGHADEFTIAKPAERKMVLTNILGLSTYDKLENQARQRAGKRETEKLQAENLIQEFGRELAQKPTYERELAEADLQLAGADQSIREVESRLTGLRQDRESLNAKQQQLSQIDQQMAQASRDAARWAEQAKQGRLRVDEYEKLIAGRERIEAAYSLLVEARRKNDELNQALRLVSSLGQRRHQLEMAVERAGQTVVSEHKVAASRVDDLEAKAAKLNVLRSDLRQAQAALESALKAEETVAARRADSQSRQLEIQRLETDRARTEQDMSGIDKKLGMLSSGEGARCPLCEQDLGEEHLSLIRQKYTSEKQAASELVKSISSRIAREKAELSRIAQEARLFEEQSAKAKNAAQMKLGVLGKEVADAEEAGRQLLAEQARLSDIEERMARKDYAVAEQAQLSEVEERLVALGYDAARHESLRRELTELEKNEPARHRLEEADRLIEQARGAVATAEIAVGELSANLQTWIRARAELSSQLAALPGVLKDLAAVDAEHQELVLRQRQERDTLVSAREKLKRCLELEALKAEKEKVLSQAAFEAGIYRELTEAFGKKGIQALLIEMALPEIEAEANKLLSTMTDNRMHVKFETQRETRKGDVLETLDINIADELGTRSYEMFSGGEAFRINFAIRIALSRVLARRAGAPLPTLIVDEGFGTQDANGIEKLKEAITSVQDDFEKILVITHIEEFRDAFPVRIDVVKTPSGSTIEVN